MKFKVVLGVGKHFNNYIVPLALTACRVAWVAGVTITMLK